MIGPFASLALTALVQPAAALPGQHPAIELFVSACIEGSADLAGRQTREVRYGDLPPVVRHRYRGTRGLRFIEVMQPHRAYLIIKSDNPRDYFRRFCGVMAPGLELERAHDAVWQVIWGRPPERPRQPGSSLRYEFSNFREGYSFVAADYSEWVLLQINHIGEGGRRAFEAAARRAAAGRPPR